MKTLIGSRAAQFWFPEFRKTNDIDWMVLEKKKPEKSKLGRIEYHYAEAPALQRFMERAGLVAPPTMLYTLKMSHIFWNIHWDKNAADILWFQRQGVELDRELFNELYAAWEVIHGKKPAYLMKSNEDFFKDNVKRVYVHDSLHGALSYYEQPLYMSVKKDINKAALSYDMFLALPKLDKLRLCREEIYVTALERFMIPSEFSMNPWTVYRKAVCKLVTSMTKGWFPRFIMENWIELYKPEIDYIQKFYENEDKLCLI